MRRHDAEMRVRLPPDRARHATPHDTARDTLADSSSALPRVATGRWRRVIGHGESRGFESRLARVSSRRVGRRISVISVTDTLA
jgi:hypothetical protein